jgi:hypothetical protein
MFSFKVGNLRFRAISCFLLFGLLVSLFNNCEEEKTHERSYPRVKTNPVSGITEKGAIFNAEIYSPGAELMINHGFVWGEGDNPTLSNNKIMLGSGSPDGTYSAEIVASLSKDVVYTVKAFVQTTEHVIYGLPVTFKSLGSGGPVVYGFEPDSARWLDTLSVRGRNFSWIKEENIVKLNQVQCATLSSTDTTLKILVSKEVSDLKSLLSVETAGNMSLNIPDTFRLIPPVLKDFYPRQARWGDTLTIVGKDLQTSNSVNTITATIGGFSSKVTRKGNDTLKIMVPWEIITISNSINVKINNLNLPFSQNLTLLPPVISGISPKEGTWSTILTIKGKFHPDRERNLISMGNNEAQILSNNKDSIKVYIPENLSGYNIHVVNTSPPFTVVSADTFKLLSPVIYSISPLSGPSGTDVVITGKYFGDYYRTTVRFGTLETNMDEFSDTYIKCKVPGPLNNGPVKISVASRSQSTVYEDDFIVTNPVINNVFPLTGTFDDEITIEGANLASASVYFREEPYSLTQATVVSNTATRIVARVPLSIDSMPRKIEVQVLWSSSVYPQPFVLSPPEITSVSAPVFAPGRDITISGRNFNPVFTSNLAFWGSSPLTVISSTATEIVARIPESLPRGINPVRVKTGGYLRSGSQLFEIQSAWSKFIPPQSINWNSDPTFGSTGISFALNGVGYMMDYQNGAILSFNPSGNQFRIVATYPSWSGLSGVPCVVNQDTAYAIISNMGVFRFDTKSYTWIYVCQVPTTSRFGTALSINGSLYYGLPIDYGETNKFWKYNPSGKTWTLLNPFPDYTQQSPVGSFTLNNKGYVLFYDNVFCSYDPATDTWTRLASYPGVANYSWGRASFAIGNLGYAGLGLEPSSGQAHDEIWAYDPIANIWTQTTRIPEGGKYNSYSFVINNKAYIGFGMNLWIPHSDIFEYDPSYPAK